MGWFTQIIPHSHTYNVVAFDHGYHTTYGDCDEKTYHHITFSKCDCGHRKVTVTPDRTQHGPITRARHAWIEQETLRITSKADVYDDNYQQTDVQTHINTWEYKPITGVQKIVNSLRDDQEFKQLQSHQLVADAFAQLETVIKLHENIDTD